jgi:hypothetical protein
MKPQLERVDFENEKKIAKKNWISFRFRFRFRVRFRVRVRV